GLMQESRLIDPPFEKQQARRDDIGAPVDGDEVVNVSRGNRGAAIGKLTGQSNNELIAALGKLAQAANESEPVEDRIVQADQHHRGAMMRDKTEAGRRGRRDVDDMSVLTKDREKAIAHSGVRFQQLNAHGIISPN